MKIDASARQVYSERDSYGSHLCYTINGATDRKDAFHDARNDFADASLDTRLVTEVGDIFACFADDDACVFGAHKRAKREVIRTGR
jgi:hypothetical protein